MDLATYGTISVVDEKAFGAQKNAVAYFEGAMKKGYETSVYNDFVAKAKYEEEVKKVKAVTVAEKEYQVAQLDAKKALEYKKKIVAQGQAEAEANRLKVAAGLTPQERAEWDYKTKVGIAEQMSKVKFPSLMIIGGDGKGNSLDPFQAVGLESFIKIQKQLDK